LELEKIEEIASKYGIKNHRVHLLEELPLDPRHNSKIDRRRLRKIMKSSRMPPPPAKPERKGKASHY
jgi:hypothetical protein